MNISYNWLKEYVDFDLTAQQVCDALTSTGLEVDALEEVQSIKGGLKGLYVGKVLKQRLTWVRVNPHRLCVVLPMWLQGRR